MIIKLTKIEIDCEKKNLAITKETNPFYLEPVLEENLFIYISARDDTL